MALWIERGGFIKVKRCCFQLKHLGTDEACWDRTLSLQTHKRITLSGIVLKEFILHFVDLYKIVQYNQKNN